MSAIQDAKNGEVLSSPSLSPSKNSPKSSPTKKDIDVATQALNHFAQGKRHLLVSDVNSAVNSLQEACRLLAEHYGETAFECADAYYYYGRALLEMARIENGVLGNALDGVPEGDDADNSQVEDPEKMTEDERDLVSEAVGEALEENFKENEKKVKSSKNGVEASAKEMDAEEMELSVSKSGEKVEDSNNKLKNSVEPNEKTKERLEALQTKKNNLKKSEESTAEKSEESKTVKKSEESTVEKSEESKTVEKSKSSEKSESNSAEQAEESKSAVKSEESKSVEISKESKSAEKSEESKCAEKSEESKCVEKSEESKSAGKSEESKSGEKSGESKLAEHSEETQMDTSESPPKETSEDNKENLEATVDKKAAEKTAKSILKESSNQKEEEKLNSVELNKDETMEVESVTKKEEVSTESEGECDKKDVEEDGADENKEDADEENGEGEDETEAEESQEEPEGDQTEEEEDVGNLQLSWEMFELSKVIFLKQEVVNQQKVSQAYLKLGEVGLESENYSQSIEDFTSCLEIQKKTLQPDDRCLAETYYQLGVAHSFSDDFDKAMDNFSAAANVIETRISNLKNKIKEKESWTEEQKHKAVTEQEDPFYTEQGEIDELDKLLPEIKEKLVDMEEMKKDTKEKLEKVKEATFASVLGGSRSAGTSSGEASTSEGFSCGFSEATKEGSVNKIEAKPTSNISHLIRKKRKPEEEAEKEDLKKAKGDAGAEQVSAVNGTSKLEKMETDSVPVKKEEDKCKVVSPVDDKMECSTTA